MSEATADTATEAPQTTPEAPETAATDGSDLTAEVEKWKAQARKHEDRAKANAAAAKELERVRQESMTEQDRAVAEARAEARSEALREVGADRVDDAVRVALAGRTVDVDALLDGLDRGKFLDDDGQPLRDAIATWADRIAPVPAETEKPPPAFPDLGQGARNTTPLGSDPLLAALTSIVGPPRT